MSVATQLFAPGYEPEPDPDCPVDDAPARRAYLRALPLAEPGWAPAKRRAAAPVVPPVRRAGASVAVLLAPEPEAAPVRLTRRGIVVLALLVAAVGATLVWIAALSAPSPAASGGSAPAGPVPAVVTVEAGDTLWSIAGRVAPGTDPRAEVEHLRQLNDLSGVALEPGQQLRVR